jgi:hypothetical protein
MKRSLRLAMAGDGLADRVATRRKRSSPRVRCDGTRFGSKFTGPTEKLGRETPSVLSGSFFRLVGGRSATLPPPPRLRRAGGVTTLRTKTKATERIGRFARLRWSCGAAGVLRDCGRRRAPPLQIQGRRRNSKATESSRKADPSRLRQGYGAAGTNVRRRRDRVPSFAKASAGRRDDPPSPHAFGGYGAACPEGNTRAGVGICRTADGGLWRGPACARRFGGYGAVRPTWRGLGAILSGQLPASQ